MPRVTLGYAVIGYIYMSTRTISFSEGEFYHVYNRGTDKRTIYESDPDYKRFQELLFLSNTADSISVRNLKRKYKTIYEHSQGNHLVSVGAYCLMPNHFHILLTPLVEGGVSLFMNKLTTGYSMYFNQKYQRSGRLFEGSFKAKHVSEDVYLKYLFAYIHLNPVKLIDKHWKEEGIKNPEEAYEYVASYKYSSLSDFLDTEREEEVVLSKDRFPDYFSKKETQKQELLEWLEYDKLDQG